MTTKNGLKYSGILIPSEWGRDGEIIGISLESQNEREYVLHPESPVLSELKGLLRRRVRLEGHMVEAAGGEVLFVSGYSLT